MKSKNTLFLHGGTHTDDDDDDDDEYELVPVPDVQIAQKLLPVPDPYSIQRPNDDHIALNLVSDDLVMFSDPNDENDEPMPKFDLPKTVPKDHEVCARIVIPTIYDLKKLLSFVQPNPRNLNAVKYLFFSPFEPEVIRPILVEWYHDENAVSLLYEQAEPEKTNKWLFKLLYAMKEKVRLALIDTYFIDLVNPCSKIDLNDDFSLLKIRGKIYFTKEGRIRTGEFLNDLRRISAHIDLAQSVFILKVKSSLTKKYTLTMMNESQYEKKLKTIKIFRKVTAYDIYNFGKNANFLTLEQMAFYSPDPNVFSFFQGYDYVPLDRFDIQIIKPFLDHILTIICSANHELFEYVTNWLAYIFQNPAGKTGTALILIGLPGTGKNTFTDTICRLLGEYSIPNAKIDHITGTFNSLMLYKKLIVCNEVKAFSSNRNFDSNDLKDLITEDSVGIHKKFQDVNTQENVSNFIFLSNFLAPISIEDGDRRYFVTEVSSAKAKDTKYFSALRSTFTENFYRHLLTYFLTKDISQWDKTQIPLTNLKKTITEYSKSPYAAFIQYRIKDFLKGFIKSEAYYEYKDWCKLHGYNPGKLQEFRLGILTYCDDTRPWASSQTRPYYYKLREDKYPLFDIPTPAVKEISKSEFDNK